MTEQELIKIRGEIIEKTIKIERLLDVLITQHYLKSVKSDFLTEVLYDELFSFGLKTNIVKKIYTDDKLFNDLRRLGSIRNCFAHTGLTIYEFIDKTNQAKGVKIRNPNPKELSEDLDYQNLNSEFSTLQSKIESKLFDLFINEGGIANKAS